MQPLFQWKSNKYYIIRVRVCSLRYPACNAQAPYCHLCPARFYNIFPLYLTNATIFEKKIQHKMCVLIFSATFVWNISHFNKNWVRYDHTCTLVIFTVVPCILILSKLYYQLMHKRIALKWVLKFSLNQLQHVSV